MRTVCYEIKRFSTCRKNVRYQNYIIKFFYVMNIMLCKIYSARSYVILSMLKRCHSLDRQMLIVCSLSKICFSLFFLTV